VHPVLRRINASVAERSARDEKGTTVDRRGRKRLRERKNEEEMKKKVADERKGGRRGSSELSRVALGHNVLRLRCVIADSRRRAEIGDKRDNS